MAPRIGKRGRIEEGGRKLVYVTKGSKKGENVDIRDEKRLATFHLRMPHGGRRREAAWRWRWREDLSKK